MKIKVKEIADLREALKAKKLEKGLSYNAVAIIVNRSFEDANYHSAVLNKFLNHSHATMHFRHILHTVDALGLELTLTEKEGK